MVVGQLAVLVIEAERAKERVLVGGELQSLFSGASICGVSALRNVWFGSNL